MFFQKTKRSKRAKPSKKTWIRLFREAMQLKNVGEGKQWLNTETYRYKKANQQSGTPLTTQGARLLLKENLTHLAHTYFSQKEVDHLKTVIGISRRIFG